MQKSKLITYYLLHRLFIVVMIQITLYIATTFWGLPSYFYPNKNTFFVLFWLFMYVYNIISPFVEVNVFSYKFDNKRLVYKSGVYEKSVVTIPINRIQHLTTKRSPLKNLFNVGVIEVTTANSKHALKYLSIEEADMLAVDLSNYVFDKVQRLSQMSNKQEPLVNQEMDLSEGNEVKEND